MVCEFQTLSLYIYIYIYMYVCIIIEMNNDDFNPTIVIDGSDQARLDWARPLLELSRRQWGGSTPTISASFPLFFSPLSLSLDLCGYALIKNCLKIENRSAQIYRPRTRLGKGGQGKKDR